MAVERFIDAPDPNEHGWIVKDGAITVRWGSKGTAPPQLLNNETAKLAVIQNAVLVENPTFNVRIFVVALAAETLRKVHLKKN